MFIMGHLGHSGRAHFSEAWMELNLTIAQLKCLFYIDSQGQSNQKTLAAVLGVTPPNVTGIIDRMVEQHLVTRHENENNRRMQVIELTAKSKSLLSELKERKVNHLAGHLDLLKTEDLEALSKGLKALNRIEQDINKIPESHATHPIHH
jgi:MarR family transcriptional regulator, organic hydroperoxide resistance regulator